MKKTIIFILTAVLFCSCARTIDQDYPAKNVNLLEFKVMGQMGSATIERGEVDGSATIYVMDTPGYPYSAVPVTEIVVSYGATANVKEGETLNFSNPERRAKIIVTASDGKAFTWWVYIKPYDAFFVGKWKITECKLHCDQNVSGVGTGAWDTQFSGSEFGNYGKPEYDDIIIIEMDETIKGNTLTGTIEHTPGNDGEYGDFFVVIAPYSEDKPLDMNPRLRHLLPPGKATWEINLNTGQLDITQNKLTSSMIFGTDQWGQQMFRFILPSAADEPQRDNDSAFDNMWRSSTELFYVVNKITD